MKKIGILFSIFLFTSCILLFRTSYRDELENASTNNDRSIELLILNKYPIEGERERIYKKWLDDNSQQKNSSKQVNYHLFFLGDSIKDLMAIGLDYDHLKLEYRDTVFNALRFYIYGSKMDERHTNVLIKDEKIYLVFSGQSVIGDPNYRFELRVREVW